MSISTTIPEARVLYKNSAILQGKPANVIRGFYHVLGNLAHMPRTMSTMSSK